MSARRPFAFVAFTALAITAYLGLFSCEVVVNVDRSLIPEAGEATCGCACVVNPLPECLGVTTQDGGTDAAQSDAGAADAPPGADGIAPGDATVDAGPDVAPFDAAPEADAAPDADAAADAGDANG